MHKTTTIRLDDRTLKKAKIKSIEIGKSLSGYIEGLIDIDLKKKNTH